MNPFSGRDPAPPDANTQTLEPAYRPEVVLSDIIQIYRSAAVDGYAQLLADTFRFSPDHSDSLDYPTQLADWGPEQEISMHRAIFQSFQAVLSLVEAPDIPVPADQDNRVTWARRYHVDLFPTGTDSVGEIHAQGIALFTMNKYDDNLWRMTHLQDQADSGLTTWGEIRARFR